MTPKDTRKGRRQLKPTDLGTPVKVYYNLHRKCFSVLSHHTGRVIGHVESIRLADVQFHVRQSGRERVLREKKKNVHAYVRGLIQGWDEAEDLFDLGEKISYNPYVAGHFWREGGDRVDETDKCVLLTNKQIREINQ